MTLHTRQVIDVHDDHVVVCNGRHYCGVLMADFLQALAEHVAPNDTGHCNFARMALPRVKSAGQNNGAVHRSFARMGHCTGQKYEAQVRGSKGVVRGSKGGSKGQYMA